VTRAFDILVPYSEVTIPLRSEASGSSSKKVIWVPSPPEGYATHFTVLFTTAEMTAAALPGWPGQRAMGNKLIWKAELPSAQTVWLVALDRPVDDWLRRTVIEYKQSGLPHVIHEIEEAGYSRLEEVRAVIYGRDEQTGMRWYIDISGLS